MQYNFKIFWLFAKQSLQVTTQGRIGIIIFTLGKIIRFAFLFFLLFFIFSKTKTLKGYTFQQAALFYMVFNVIDTVSQVLFREVYRFRTQVASGTLDTILLKPFHPFLKILVGGVDVLDILLLIPYIFFAFFFAVKETLTLLSLLSFLVLFINALWIATSFHIIVLALGVLTSEVDHTILIYRDMTSLGRFPMAIYKEPIKSIFTFIIPVGIMTSFPPQALLGTLPPIGYISAFVISSLLFMGAMSLWNYALQKYQSWGG